VATTDRRPASTLGLLSPTDIAASYLGAYTNNLRTCCQALVQYCVRRSCCFVSPTSKEILSSPFSVYSADDPSIPPNDKVTTMLRTDVRSSQDVLNPREKLQLEIRGMDCVDCVPKVGRALSQLPSITSTTTDYYAGIAELQYDPETISPTAIAAYVARATGFSVKAVTALAHGTAGVSIALPIAFSTIPPPEAFDGFNTRPDLNSRTIEVSFPVHVDSPLRPREVLDQFKAYGAELVPPGSDVRDGIATRDLLLVGARTITCALLSIPVLVFAWADLPHRPVLYGGISVGLTTLIQALAFPIFSSAIRAILYLHQLDMNVLVSVSTLMAYIFCVVAYGCEVAGKPFSAPFFETNALLITLIFLGRTVSAATRRSTGSALRELQGLQPANVLLCEGEAPPQDLDSRLLYYGDVIRIPPETRIATDGLVISGSSDADESSLTGESVAVPKEPGSRVIAGTLEPWWHPRCPGH
jgi:cation transport ATPase